VLLGPELEENIILNVTRALAEDIGSGDITALLVPASSESDAAIISREEAVICGIPWVNEVFKQLDPGIKLAWTVAEGDDIASEQIVCEIQGNSRNILTGERTALNFLQLLSGTATLSREYANLVTNTSTRILDTRKTIPGLRLAQKYAVRIGGCHNHRMGLYDAFLIKENHIAACGGIEKAVARAREVAPGRLVEVEVETLEEFDQALSANSDRIMLDNFAVEDIYLTVKRDNARDRIEISGGLTKNEISELIKKTSIPFFSTGQLTKNCRAIDFSMRLRSAGLSTTLGDTA
jgi:nicotinate-nucleotide pyrophosphorylase (carboxylating)